MFTLQVKKNGAVRLTVPGTELRDGFPVHRHNGKFIPFLSKLAAQNAGLDAKDVQSEYVEGKRTLESLHPFMLRMGMNPDGNELLDADLEFEKQVEAERSRRNDELRITYAAQRQEAIASGTRIAVKTSRWTETRRAREGGEWGDYVFACTETLWVEPDGSFNTTQSAVNTY
jgi:hypothetical protein